EPVLRTEMDRTGARQSRPHHYAGRPPRADGSLRAFNLTAARLAARGQCQLGSVFVRAGPHDLELFLRASSLLFSILAQPAFRHPCRPSGGLGLQPVHPTPHRIHGAESAGPFREALRLTVDAPVPRLSGTALDQLKQAARPTYHRPSPNLRML